MTSPLNSNWQFMLSSAIRRGEWFIHSDFNSLAMQIMPLLQNQIPAGNNVRGNYNVQARAGNLLSIPEKDMFSQNKVIAIFPVKGDMLKYGTECSYGTEEIAAFMKECAASEKVVGAVLDIDSSGGEVSSIAPLLQAIDAFRAKGKPVIAVADCCCSAAYYTAAKCDFIFAENDIDSFFGSIGVMASWIDIIPYLEKQGYKAHTVYAPESSEKNKIMEQAQQSDYEAYKNEILSPLAKRFQEDVKKFRGARLKTETEGILNGKTYFAAAAIANGLIDGMGDINKAVQLILELTNNY